MSSPPSPAGRSTAAALGLRAVRGGAVVVAIRSGADGPRLVLSTFLATSAPGDRLSLEPFQVAQEMARDAPGQAPANAVAAGRRRQNALATQALEDILARLGAEGFRPGAAALLINRAGWVSDLLSYGLSMPEHAAVAEGLAVRDALRAALAAAGLRTIEMDEKSLHETALERLSLHPADLENQMKALGAAAGRPWRKEQKLACIAAWLATTPARP